MHNLEMFTKDVLLYVLWSNHPFPVLHLYTNLACCNLALNLLNNVAVSLLTWSSVLTCALLVIHAPYELDLAILSFIIIPYYCWMPSHAMKCFLMSDLSSQRCLHNSVYAMLSFSAKSESVYELAMFTWVPSYLLCLFGSWSLRDFCYMQLVDICHAFFCYDIFL